MREYLQSYLLRIMSDAGVFEYAAFVGGTALRFIYDLPRFSEDIDLSLTRRKPGRYFYQMLERTRSELELAGYAVSISYNDKKNVNHAFVGFSGLLKDAGLSSLKEQKLSIKIELDIKPPKGAIVDSAIVNKYFPLTFTTFDRSSLLAGKLHALASRSYTKGRDWFDIVWYLSKWKGIAPNIPLLRNSLKQTKYKGDIPAMGDWKNFVHKMADKCDWAKARSDVERFLENPSDVKLLTKENVIKLLSAA